MVVDEDTGNKDEYNIVNSPSSHHYKLNRREIKEKTIREESSNAYDGECRDDEVVDPGNDQSYSHEFSESKQGSNNLTEFRADGRPKRITKRK
mmetsp:Transcript_25121/g.28903  ORF Transcript_25121/g.28903 Transcript_25121/m.28903 type:complete len:93 (+) Transcript_25121:153-431(+)